MTGNQLVKGSQTLKFEQGTLSKMALPDSEKQNDVKNCDKRDKFDSIINSAGLKGLIMNHISYKQASD